MEDSTDLISFGMVGLGRMGANIARRAMRRGHIVVGFDPQSEVVADLASEGVHPAHSLEELVALLPQPRNVWVMVPAGAPTQSVIEELSKILDAGDCVIDGGNSYYRDDIEHAKSLRAREIEFIDVGTSGGVWGLERGYSLMIGGSTSKVQALTPLWQALAPGVATAPRTNSQSDLTDAEQGWLHCGPNGAGHFVKMVHNGIEYAMMAAFAEGFNILKNADVGSRERQQDQPDAETAPLRDANAYQYHFDLPAIAEVWRRGSVVSSWLLDLTAQELQRDPSLAGFAGRVSDSGEGRWTSIAAIEEGVPAPVLTMALYSRLASQGSDTFANQVLSAMRKGFGGHNEKSQ